MIESVYASEGGHRFHLKPNCRNLLNGQELYGGWGSLRIHRADEMTLPEAFGRGKEPCATCYPGLRASLYRGNSEDDFGHWPTRGISLNSLCDDVCQRCTEPGVWYGRGVDELTPVQIPWPCTSAIVLGLVERAEAAA